MRKTLCVTLCIYVLLCLCSCTRVITNNADELTFSSWGYEFKNGNSVNLSFANHNATLELYAKGVKKVVISGFCEINDTQFVIYDSKTKYGFAFEYIVYFDHVDIVYDNTTLSLNKI